MELIESEGPDSLLGVPTMLIGLLGHPRFPEADLVRAERVASGGATLAPDLVRSVEAGFGARLSIVFAQTEASPVIAQASSEDSDADRAETLGRPLPRTEVRIVDPTSGKTVHHEPQSPFPFRGFPSVAGDRTVAW